MTVATIPNFICLQDHYNFDRAYNVNGLNQLTTAGALSLTYDNRGNLTSDGTNSYTYDIENRLITGPSGVTLSYDPYGRLAKTTGSATTRMGYDGQDLIAEYDASGTLLRRYVHGDGSDDPILWYEGAGTTDKRYMHKDERGSVIALTDGSGGIVGINAYDDYGIPAATNIGRFQYTGQQYLSDLGLYHYKARIYSPTLGRFLQTDPIGYGDGMNLYAYVGGDPVNGVDPTGTIIIVIGPRTRMADDSGGGVSGRAGHSNPGFAGNSGGTGGPGRGPAPPPNDDDSKCKVPLPANETTDVPDGSSLETPDGNSLGYNSQTSRGKTINTGLPGSYSDAGAKFFQLSREAGDISYGIPPQGLLVGKLGTVLRAYPSGILLRVGRDTGLDFSARVDVPVNSGPTKNPITIHYNEGSSDEGC